MIAAGAVRRGLGRAAGIVALAACLPAAARTALAQPTAVIAAAGDISCDPMLDPNYNGGNGTATFCHMKATSDLLVAGGYTTVLTLGDNQYEDGTLLKYLIAFEPSWGRVKALIKPVPGNHEYLTPGATGYYAYFGAAAGDPAKGYYSYDLGGWHLIALNSNCLDVGGCNAGSPQELWLAADLAAHPGVCTLAYWHHPRFSSGPHGDDPTYDAFWQDLHAAGADVVLNGHDHDYERFAPQDASGSADAAGGVREFVVGTGGKNQTAWGVLRANSVVRSNDTFGVLKLKLYPYSYEWQFVPEAGKTFTDSGGGLCHRTAAAGLTRFHTVTPCRLADTRTAGPALGANTERTFSAAGVCGVPNTALAVALNVTAVGATELGDLRIYPRGAPVPLASTINFPPTRARANNAIVALGVAGQLAVLTDMAPGSTGQVHAVLDVTGYFAP
jgi:hypothetical protein